MDSKQVSLGDIFLTSLKLGLTSFGGPVAHIGYFERTFVREKAWLGPEAFARIVALCQVLPGPASSQVNFLIGWRQGGLAGALLSWLGFTLPSALLMLGFAMAAPALPGGQVDTVLHGLKLVAVAVVAQAVWSMAPRLCPDVRRALIAISALMASLFVPEAWAQVGILVLAAMAGGILCRGEGAGVDVAADVAISRRSAGFATMAFVVLLLGLPLVAVATSDRLFDVLDISYRSGALVFGGGHVVLPLLRDSMVPAGLVSDHAFLSGYGAAQALPGPLFTFATYLGAMAAPSGAAPWWAALATMFVFLPGLLLAVAGAPLWQGLGRHAAAAGAFAGVNAAVVGILGAALYDPVLTSSVRSGADLAIAVAGFGLLQWAKVPPIVVVVLTVVAARLATPAQ